MESKYRLVSEVSDESEIIIYIASPLCAMLLITIASIVWRLCIRSQRLHPPGNRNEGAQLSVVLKSILEDEFQRKLTDLLVARSTVDVQELLGQEGAQLSVVLKSILEDEVQRKLTDLLVARSTVDVQELLGQGAFGLVYKGTYTTGDRVHDKQTMAIKTLKTNCTDTQISGLAEEAVVMSNFEHMHVLSIIAVCIRPEDGVPMLILPFMDNGDLRTYLRQFSSGNQEKTAPDEKQLVTFCLHIARGMEYLAGKKFVHRDLAARNCMLDAQRIVKIADFGLSRDIYTSSYYRVDQQKCLPVKWLPLESLQYQTFTVHSDVWSFGVTMWEILTLGMMPYTTVDNIDMKQHLQSGARLERPDNSSNSMYYLMLGCWTDIPESRPSFSDISTILADTVAEMSEYIELNVYSHNYARAQNDGHSLGRELITAECGMDSATTKLHIRDHSENVGAELTKTESTAHTSPEDNA